MNKLLVTALLTGGLALGGSLVACSSDDSSPANGSAGSAGSDGGAGDGAVATTGKIENATAGSWTWAPVENAFCRDGSPTGIAVNPGTSADKTMIFLEGGGACYNSSTCLLNPAAFNFTAWSQGGLAASTGPKGGILDRTNPANPVKDWNFVYVPYCTGDTHSGNNPTATIDGVTTGTKFVGYQNVTEDLKRIVLTFTNQSKVLLAGISAGGFGAAANYVQVAQAFAPVPVNLIDDSGPPMSKPYLASCLQTQWVNLWGFQKTILQACGSDCPDPTNYLVDYTNHIGRTYPNVQSGFIDSVDDGIITKFFGYGNDDCAPVTGFSIPSLTAQQYLDGLNDVKQKTQGNKNFGSFIFPGADHTSLGLPAFYTRQATTTAAAQGCVGDGCPLAGNADGGVAEGGAPQDAGATDAATTADAGPPVKLVDWVTNIVNGGTPTNVGP